MSSKSMQYHNESDEILSMTLASITEGLTGLAASERKDFALSVGRVIQAARSHQFLSQLQREWKSYRKKGRIPDDYPGTEQHQVCLHELLRFLEEDIPDERRFEVMRDVFLTAATESKSNRDSSLPHEYMRLCRRLEPGDVLLLRAAYTAAKAWYDKIMSPDNEAQDPRRRTWGNANKWGHRMADTSGLVHLELVWTHEKRLIESRLLEDCKPDENGEADLGLYYRLSSLGWDLCRYIDHDISDA